MYAYMRQNKTDFETEDKNDYLCIGQNKTDFET